MKCLRHVFVSCMEGCLHTYEESLYWICNIFVSIFVCLDYKDCNAAVINFKNIKSIKFEIQVAMSKRIQLTKWVIISKTGEFYFLHIQVNEKVIKMQQND